MAGAENTEARIKDRIKDIYSKLEDLTFKGSFQKRVTMEQFRLKVPRTRPVYVVKDHDGVKVLDKIYREIKEFERSLGGREVWKGITRSGDTYKLWGTEYSADRSFNGVYHVVGIEVIVNCTEKYRAVVNISVDKGKKRLLEIQQDENQLRNAEGHRSDKQAESPDIQQESLEMMLRKLEQAKANNETIKVSYTTVLFSGSSGVGKTSLLRKLSKERLIRYHHSTGVANSKHTICVKTTAISKSTEGLQWVNLDYNSMINHLNQYLHNTKFQPKSLRLWKENTPGGSTNRTGSKKIKLDVDAAQPDEVAVDIAKADSSDVPSLGDVWNIINFLDTGGQPEFVNILPAVSSSIALTFIVLNLKEDLNKLVHVQHNVNGEPSFEPYNLDCTNLEFIKRLMVSSENFNKNVMPPLSSIQRQDGGNDSKICYVGTHALDLSDEKIQEIDDDLSTIATQLELHRRSFWSPPKEELQRLFPVELFPGDTNKSLKYIMYDIFRNAHVIEDIREKILQHVQGRDYYEVPIRWLLFLLKLQRLCHVKKVSYISYQEATGVWVDENASEVGSVSEDGMGTSLDQSCLNEDQIEMFPRHKTCVHTILLFFHFMGMLFYYHAVKGMCDFVVIDRQWLFTKLTELVELKFTKSYKKKDISAEDLEKFTKEGRLNISIINNLKIDLQGIEPLYFINLLDHLNIVACFDPEQKEYFMPCVLPSFTATASDLDKLYGKTQHAPLLVGFKNGPMPHGFFCQLIVELLKNLPTSWLAPLLSTLRIQHAYNNLITFHTTSGHCISLFYKTGYIEIQVRHGERQPVVIHINIQRELHKALRGVSSDLQLNEEQLRYGFYCKCKEVKHFAELKGLALPSPIEALTTEYISCRYSKIKLTKDHKVWFQGTENDTILTGNTPTMQDLLLNLQGLNNWDTFGYFLLPKEKQYLIERIKRDHVRAAACKTALYEEFFKCGVVTWNTVITALEKSGELCIAKQVKMKVTQ